MVFYRDDSWHESEILPDIEPDFGGSRESGMESTFPFWAQLLGSLRKVDFCGVQLPVPLESFRIDVPELLRHSKWDSYECLSFLGHSRL